ncbi:MAG: GAF domain-containing protein [bacterium]|nr:GAF domain-containing protein [bacterium]
MKGSLRRASSAPFSADDRVGFVLVLFVIGIAVVAMLLYGVLAFQWRGQPYFGALMARSLIVDGSQPLNTGEWNGLAAGLQRRDQLVAINGVTLSDSTDEAIQQFRGVMEGLSETGMLNIEILRPVSDGEPACGPVTDGFARCTFEYPAQPFPATDFLALFGIPYMSGILTLGVGIAAFILRSRQPSARTVAALSALLALFMAGLFDLNTTYSLNGLWIIAVIMLGSTLISFVMVFPVKASLLYVNPVIRYVPVAFGLMLCAVMYSLYLNPPTPDTVLTVQQVGVIAGLVGAVVTIVTLFYRRRRATNAIIRDQANTVLIGFGLSLILGGLWVLNSVSRGLLGVEVVPLNTSAAMPFMVLPALSMVYAVLQYRSVDTDRILSQAITYGVMLFALIIGYFLLVLSATLLAGRAINAADPVLLAVVIFVVVVLFVPVRTGLQRLIDRVYFRQRVDYQQRLEQVGQKLSSLVNTTDILREYQQQLDETLLPSTLFVFLPDRATNDYAAINTGAARTDIRIAPDSPMIAYLRELDDVIYLEPNKPWDAPLLSEKPRLMILHSLVIVGLRGSNRLNGFVCIGPPRDGSRQYSFEQLRFIQNISAQISVAVERALVVDSLERRVRELDVLSQVSQAANFSVDFDALLELIINQANKLIDAPHFYITLRDPVTNALYHAFFLEGDDRDRSKENVRWALGRDLFSEVIREARTLCVGNFAAEMAKRSAPIDLENPAMRAWMAVPMNAGSGVLGVLSAGTTDPDVYFTDEQMKVFNDVAALAATSIDKARLFNETNTRARQLQALNDISRQIVASEADIEELLNLITASATEILNADAGSLLLTADDGSRDLVFRVVSGGSGSNLINVRVPAGKGLVGEVAKTGQPVIVNDVKTDPRWAGELAKGSFQTNNVLAVPLVSQEGVIGVLEVLNKRDGGFSTDEVELLITFAGQAAVAIENARLFQQTDLALSQRVSELETLERIDIELTRSLDLRKVAEITVTWAMENSSATAAMLGLVTGDPPHLQVIYRAGYDEDDLPEAGDNGLIPLDRGIVSRVLRTRQAELVPDVRYDRDYIPSLKGALSQITLPMLSGGQINALLIMETDREPRLRLADMAFLTRLTEHAAIAIANAQLYSEVARANQSKIQTVGFVAHELKNPLTVIRGYSDTLLGPMGSMLNETQRAALMNTIRATADRMTTLVNDLEDVTKLQTGNMRVDVKEMAFHPVIEETLRPLTKQIEEKEQKLVLNVPESLPPVMGDMKRLIQVLLNLVSNAHKYSPEEGTITVGAFVDESLTDRKGRPLAPMLHVYVQDTGIGMSPEDLSKLFTPYFRSSNPLAQEQKGTGVGLTITQGILRQHGGDIWVESALGVGSTFHFTVPLAEERVGK